MFQLKLIKRLYMCSFLFVLVVPGCYEQRAVSTTTGHKELVSRNYRKGTVKIRYFNYTDKNQLVKKGKKISNFRGTWTQLLEYEYLQFDSISGQKIEFKKQKQNGILIVKKWSHEKYQFWGSLDSNKASRIEISK